MSTAVRGVPAGVDPFAILSGELARLRTDVDDLRSTALARIGVGGVMSQTSRITTDEATTSTSLTDLVTVQSVTLTTGTRALVLAKATTYCGTVPSAASINFVVSGATTRAAQAIDRSYVDLTVANKALENVIAVEVSDLTAGINTLTLKFASPNGNDVHWDDRHLTVINLGS